jgi:hypothetical protein
MSSLPAFLVVALVVVTPDPDTALTIHNTLLGGRRWGVFTGIGVAEDAVIAKVLDPVAAPAENAAEVVRWLEARDIQGGWSGGGP